MVSRFRTACKEGKVPMEDDHRTIVGDLWRVSAFWFGIAILALFIRGYFSITGFWSVISWVYIASFIGCAIMMAYDAIWWHHHHEYPFDNE